MKVTVSWKENLCFEAKNKHNSIVIPIDSIDEELGGQNKGVTPKEMFLQSIAGCSGIDVILILKKMRAEMPEKFEMVVSGVLTEEHPKVFSEISLDYNFFGNTEKEKIIKAVTMSQEKYCGISAMVKKIANFKYRIFLNNQELA